MAESGTRSGTVYLVGSGPGDVDLITVRGWELIQRADVIVYDRLIPGELLAGAKDGAVLVDVGKRPEHHPVRQDEINALLVDYAKRYRVVVRLKGGDPYLFGRGAEEALYLAEHGIGFEVVPGITAATAVSAYAGMPLTHRDYTSQFSCLTGHEKDAAVSRINWEAVATSGATVAIYMGVGNSGAIAERLMEHGLAGDTPVGVVQRATTPRQRTVVTTVGDLAATIEREGVTAPALILIGAVVGLTEKLNWFERLPLFGERVVVTRTRRQASGVVKELRRLGAEAVEFPTIEIEPIMPNAELDGVLERLGEYDWVVFTSVNAVGLFFERLKELGGDSRRLAGVKVGVIGTATAGELETYGIKADVVPGEYVAEALAGALAEVGALAGAKVLLPRAAEAREVLVEQLQERGAAVTAVAVYRTVVPGDVDVAGMKERITQGEVDWVTFSSSSTVRHFCRLVGAEMLAGVKVASIGPITSRTLGEYGVVPRCQAEVYTIAGLVEAIRKDVLGWTS